MPHALLLSPDDQAVSAITAVLEEMSVTCERPLDGVSAAQKLNAHSFDLVLVDCENLPAAKLIFDVCRRGKNGNNPVPIAIVDGRAGLPTAFRLGAELILTKPVAKDQARTTIRTAVSRVRKDVQTKESVPAQTASAATTSAVMTEECARAAAAVSTAVASAASTATLSAPAVTMEMQSAVDEIDSSPATPKSNPQSASFSASSSSESSSALESPSDRAASVHAKPARPAKPSDDPVLAELEESELAESQPESSGPAKAVLSSYQQGQRKRRSPLVALLMLALAGAAFYAAWTYQPGFRAIAQPQIDRVLALAGMALPPVPAPNPAQPSAQLPPATTSAPAPQSPTAPNQTQSTLPDTATGSARSSAAGSPKTSADAAAPLQPAATPGSAVKPPTSGATSAVAPVVAKPEASKPSDSKKDPAAASSSGTQLPGENGPIILSSQGAEKRLAYSVPAKYPIEAHSGQAQGTVVLKVVVDETGKVEGIRLIEGNATLATAAMQAVKQWRYRPYVRDGKAQPFQTVVIVDFQRP